MCPAYLAGLIGPGDRALCRHTCAHCRRSRPSGQALPGPGTCQERKPGGWASIARMANANTTSRTCLPTPRSKRCRRDQGPLDMRAGPSATQGRTWPGPLRGPVLDRTSPPRFEDDDWLCLPAIPPDRSGGTEKRVLGPPPQPSLPAVRQAILDHLPGSPPSQCPCCGCLLSTTPITLLPKQCSPGGALSSQRATPHNRIRPADDICGR